MSGSGRAGEWVREGARAGLRCAHSQPGLWGLLLSSPCQTHLDVDHHSLPHHLHVVAIIPAAQAAQILLCFGASKRGRHGEPPGVGTHTDAPALLWLHSLIRPHLWVENFGVGADRGDEGEAGVGGVLLVANHCGLQGREVAGQPRDAALRHLLQDADHSGRLRCGQPPGCPQCRHPRVAACPAHAQHIRRRRCHAAGAQGRWPRLDGAHRGEVERVALAQLCAVQGCPHALGLGVGVHKLGSSSKARRRRRQDGQRQHGPDERRHVCSAICGSVMLARQHGGASERLCGCAGTIRRACRHRMGRWGPVSTARSTSIPLRSTHRTGFLSPLIDHGQWKGVGIPNGLQDQLQRWQLSCAICPAARSQGLERELSARGGTFRGAYPYWLIPRTERPAGTQASKI